MSKYMPDECQEFVRRNAAAMALRDQDQYSGAEAKRTSSNPARFIQ
jgi:hypothetical protein